MNAAVADLVPERRLERVPIDTLAPYERNARTHSDAQIEQIAASIREFGFTNPILADDESRVIAGHGRLAAARLIGLEIVPVIRVGGLSDAQRRALILADNQLAANAGWDSQLLAEELGKLQGDGFNLDILGFDPEWLTEIMQPAGNGANVALPSALPEAAEREAWRMWASELAEQIRASAAIGYARQGVTPGLALLRFLQAVHEGRDYPRFAFVAFHPNIYRIPGAKSSILEGLDAIASGSLDYKRLQFVCGGDMETGRVLTSPLPFGAARLPNDFPASLARELINEFAAGGSVCDPCHGWGGRLVGFLLSSAVFYAGTDPAPETHRGVKRLGELFEPHARGSHTIKLADSPMERWEPPIPDGGFDLALTSPPYFDVEKYEGGEQSRLGHDDYSSWRDSFYSTLIRRAFEWLRPGGTFALQVGSQIYPLLEDGKRLAKEHGFRVKETRPTDMVNNFTETEAEEGEIVLILRKPK